MKLTFTHLCVGRVTKCFWAKECLLLEVAKIVGSYLIVTAPAKMYLGSSAGKRTPVYVYQSCDKNAYISERTP